VRVLIAGGGTGGHIYPALTIGKALLEKGAEVIFAGTDKGLEKQIIPREGFRLETISVDYFPRRLSWRLVRSFFVAAKGVAEALALVRRLSPDVCVGTGGYVAGPVVLAAALSGVPTVIQEQNALPGLTNRILARFADKVAVGYEAAALSFGRGDKLVVTGNPIRPEIVAMTRQRGAARLGVDPTKRLVLITGASQGARSINHAVLEAFPKLTTLDAQFLIATGAAGFKDFVSGVRAQAGKGRPFLDGQGERFGNLMAVPYLYDMPAALAASDLVVGRAGALSIAEITARGLPAILIPYPYAAENHQEKNARVLEAAGAARVILDRELNAARLYDEIASLLADDERLAAMAEASRKLGKPDAVWEIVALIEGVVALRQGRT
jgi:undecaprenyldiphospho-muramoylpentapeptide beta-N-acetylglucosaminyltransferase